MANIVDRTRAVVALECDQAEMMQGRRMAGRFRQNAPVRRFRFQPFAGLQIIHRLAIICGDRGIDLMRRYADRRLRTPSLFAIYGSLDDSRFGTIEDQT